MLFFWMPFDDGLAIQSKWLDGGWYAPGLDAVAGVITTTAEMLLEYTLHGEQYVDITTTLSAGVSDAATLAYVDVFLRP